jgi:hypothetical protein
VRLAQRVRVVTDPAIDPNAMDPVTIRIALRDGRSLIRSGTTAKTMSERDILEKLRGCLEFGGYAPSAAERLLELAFRLDASRDAGATLVEGFPKGDLE